MKRWKNIKQTALKLINEFIEKKRLLMFSKDFLEKLKSPRVQSNKIS